MHFDKWSARNEKLNAFSKTMLSGTRELVRDLKIDVVESGDVLIRGVALSYYGLQLAIQVSKKFREQHPEFPEIQLLLSLKGKSLKPFQLTGSGATSPSRRVLRSGMKRPLPMQPAGS
ncbi:MAG: hypothetical protein WAO83_13620 [Fuerstiella sp.]|jgi:hypothetical protein